MRQVIVIGLMIACGGKAGSPAWNPQAGNELEAEIATFFVTLDNVEVDKLKANFDEAPIVFDTDASNVAVAAWGAKDSNAYLDAYVAATKEGLKVKSTVNRVECQATAWMGFCAIEFDQLFTMKDQPVGSFKFRGSAVGRKVNGAWKWSHWHGSFRELPGAQPGAVPGK